MPNKSNNKNNNKNAKSEKKPISKARVEMPLPKPIKFQHKKVLKKMSDNVRKGKRPSVSTAVVEMGYSESYAKTGRITKTKSWKAMLDEYLPESKLLDIHEKQLQSWKLQSMTFQKQIKDTDIFELMEHVGCVVKKVVEIPIGKIVFYIQPDNQSRNKALEMALKLHKRLTDKVEVKDTTPFTQLSDAELAERIKKGKNFFTKK